MGNRAFAITGGGAVVIANDIDDFRYRARPICLPVGVQVEARVAKDVETQFMVDDGFVEFMVNGATAVALPGDFVRVPAGIVFAYRNAGEEAAHLLMRTVNPAPVRRALRLIYGHAA